jgi:hypothetical protein
MTTRLVAPKHHRTQNVTCPSHASSNRQFNPRQAPRLFTSQRRVMPILRSLRRLKSGRQACSPHLSPAHSDMPNLAETTHFSSERHLTSRPVLNDSGRLLQSVRFSSIQNDMSRHVPSCQVRTKRQLRTTPLATTGRSRTSPNKRHARSRTCPLATVRIKTTYRVRSTHFTSRQPLFYPTTRKELTNDHFSICR